MKSLALAATTVLALAMAAPVSGHGGRWYVPAQTAIGQIQRSLPDWHGAQSGHSTTCRGFGGSLKPDYPGGPRYFKHFRCLLFHTSGPSEDITLVFHTLPQRRTFALTRGWYRGRLIYVGRFR